MKDKIFLIFIFSCLLFGATAQEWVYTSDVHSSGNFDINSSDLLNDSTVVILGTFKGQIDPPVNNTSLGGKDIFIAQFQNGTLQWIRSIGSTGNEYAGQLIVHESEIYLTGGFRGDCYFPDGSFLTSDGGYDIFLAKFSSTGNLMLKQKIVFSINHQVPLSLDIDKNNELVVTGFYKDTISFGTVGYNGRPTTFTNFFAKFDLNANYVLSKTYDGNSTSTRLSHIKAFDDGYYITGTFLDTLYLDIENIISTDATADVFLYKLNENGEGQWVVRTYGNYNDVPGSITQDLYGNNYFTGFFRSDTIKADSTSTLISEHNIINSNTNNTFDFFIFKYNKSGNLIWSKGYGSKGNDWARSIETRDRFVYLSGYFSDTLIFRDDTISAGSLSDEDPFIGMFNIDGDKIKAVNISGSSEYLDHAQSINLNSENQAVISGFFESPTLTFDTENELTNSTPGVRSLFIGSYIPPFSIAITNLSNITCNNGFDGNLTVTPYFGVSPFTYSWSHDMDLNDSIATNLSAGTYTVTVTDALDSTDIVQYTFPEPGSFQFNPLITNVTSCSYGNDASINLNISGGNGGNTYQWVETNGGNGVVFDSDNQFGLTAGTYSVTVTDFKGCTGDTTINIVGPAPVTFGNTIVTPYTGIDPINTGAIDLELVGGTGTSADYMVSWSGPLSYTDSIQDITGLLPGIYTATVTDSIGCVFDSTFTVLDNDNFIAFISNKKDACKGITNGKATVSYYSPDSNTDISFEWDANTGGQTTATATNLAPGLYYVTVTDNTTLATSVDSVVINELTYDFEGSLNGTIVLDCKGDNDGFIDLSITNAGILPYSYLWSNLDSTQDISGLIAGSYSVTVTDGNECSFSIEDYIITEPEFELSAGAKIISEPLCNGNYNGVISVDAAGGNGNYTYQWDDPGHHTSQMANGLNAGYYTVTVTDVKNCNTTSAINLTEPDILSVSGTTTNLDCFGDNNGTITIADSGGTIPYKYLWSTTDGNGLTPSSKNQNDLSGGIYSLTVTDNNGCETITEYFLIEPDPIDIKEKKSNNIICYGDNNGSIDIEVTGGTINSDYAFNWSTIDGSGIVPELEDQSGLGPGTYNLTITDDNRCETTNEYTLTEPEPIIIEDAELNNNIICFGDTNGKIDITVTGGTIDTGYIYSWSTIDGSGLIPGSEDQHGLGAGTYSVTVTDDNSCEASAEYTLVGFDPISIKSYIFHPTCHNSKNGAIVVWATGGVRPYSYLWSTADGSGLNPTRRNQYGLTSGTYNLTVSDANGCETTAEFILSEPDPINIELTELIDVNCHGENNGSIDITVTGGTIRSGYTFNWSTTDGSGLVRGSEDQSTVGGGTYYLTVKDDKKCKATSEFTVLEPDPIHIKLTELSNNCENSGSIDITVTGGTIDTGYTYSWSTIDGSGLIPDSEDQRGLGAGTYSVTVTDDNSCEASAEYTIAGFDPISIKSYIFHPTCHNSKNGAIVVWATGGVRPYSYLWSTTDGSGLNPTRRNQYGLTSGTYNLTVSDANGCETTAEFILSEPDPINIELTELIDVNCYGENNGSIDITVTGGTIRSGYTFNWSTTDGSGLVRGSEDQSTVGGGTYYLTVKDDKKCKATSEFTVSEPDPIHIKLTELSNNCENSGSIDITVTGGTIDTGYTYSWSTIDGTGLIPDSEDQRGLGAGTYRVTVTDDNSCEASAEYTIAGFDPISIKKYIAHPTCYNHNNGAIIIRPAGGVHPYSYFWSTTNGSGLNPTRGNQRGLTPGTYYLMVTDAIGCFVRDTIELISPLPITYNRISSADSKIINADRAVNLKASGGTGTLTYTLMPENISNSTGIFNQLSDGKYTIHITDQNYCGPIISKTFTVGIIEDIDDTIANTNIRIYPNPTNNKIFIDTDYENGYLNIEILNIFGQIIYSNENSFEILKEGLDLSNYPKGVYFVRIYNNQINFKERILVQ